MEYLAAANTSVAELQHGATVDTSDALRHRVFESASFVNIASAIIPLTSWTACRLPGKSSRGAGWDPDVIAEDHLLFCGLSFAAMLQS